MPVLTTIDPDQFKGHFGLRFYLTDSEYMDQKDEWKEWIQTQPLSRDTTQISYGSSSWSTGKRFITLIFVDKGTAALFRTFFGGDVVDYG